ncbi:MAG: TIGR04283 family arsenosugar biosynthesis glycosyltransferase [Ekhidna sp.]
MNPRISIVIPTLNEASFLTSTIVHLFDMAHSQQQFEVLVIDAGSTDGTLASIKNLGVSMYHRPAFKLKKYQSLNFGIQKARGDILLFLDADTLLPRNFDEMILTKLENPNIVGGAFSMRFDQSDWKLRILAMLNRVRYTIWKNFYGDQAIFCRKEAALTAGGFPESLMEASFFCQKLKAHGTMALISKPVTTSSRRFFQYGFFKVFWFDFRMWIRFNLGMEIHSFAHEYWKSNLENG